MITDRLISLLCKLLQTEAQIRHVVIIYSRCQRFKLFYFFSRGIHSNLKQLLNL